MTPQAPFVCIEPIWAGATVVCAGSGPSLTVEDLDVCRGKSKVIVVNDAYTLAPWADLLYAADVKWWAWHKGVKDFAGRKVTIEPQPQAWPGLQVLHNTGKEGLERTRTGLRTGSNSGYQAINLAVHLGAARIILLGYDMKGTHFFGKHRDGSVPPFQACLRLFPTLVKPLAALGIPVINATRSTALTTFPCLPLDLALAEVAA